MALQQLVAEPYVWQNVGISGGGFVTGVIMHPTQPNLMYARTDVGGAYRWDSATGRWVALTDFVTIADSNLLGVESIAVDPSDPGKVYLAAGTYTASWAGNGAILRSSDQGTTWQRTNLPIKMGGNESGREWRAARGRSEQRKHPLLWFPRGRAMEERQWRRRGSSPCTCQVQRVSGSATRGFRRSSPSLHLGMPYP